MWCPVCIPFIAQLEMPPCPGGAQPLTAPTIMLLSNHTSARATEGPAYMPQKGLHKHGLMEGVSLPTICAHAMPHKPPDKHEQLM